MTNKQPIKTRTIEDMTNDEIEEFINKHLPVKNLEKAKYGEVFTPSALINTMLDQFPTSCWSNPDLKWLDPCCGTGNFLVHVYQRLIAGLENVIPNLSKRSSHIIENMIFMFELNKKNCDICRQLFGQNANIECLDFLEYNKETMFDCIVGNPPFQDDSTVGGTGGKSKLYERIFIKSLTILKDDGYLSFLVPDNMLSGNGNVGYNELIKYDVQFVSFNSDIQSYFKGIQQYICYFLMRKSVVKRHVSTVIEQKDTNNNKNINKDKKNTVVFTTQLLDRPVNPVRNWTPYVEKLIKKYMSIEKNAAVYNRGKQLSLYNGSTYSLIYTSSKKLRTNKLELAPGLNIKKAVIFAISPNLEFEMDYTGKYGVGPNTFYIPFQTVTQGRHLEAFLKSDHYKLLALACKTSRQFLKIGFIEHLNLPKIMNFNNTSKTKSMNKNISKTKTNKSMTKNISKTKTNKTKTRKLRNL
jgi:hypothetical protein